MISYHDITEKCVNDNPNEICSDEGNIINEDAIKFIFLNIIYTQIFFLQIKNNLLILPCNDI